MSFRNSVIDEIIKNPGINDAELADRLKCEIELVQAVAKRVDALKKTPLKAPNGTVIYRYTYGRR